MLNEILRVARDPVEMERAAIDRASQAWSAFSGGVPLESITTLKPPADVDKSALFRLVPSHPKGSSLVAKELLADAAAVELAAYRDALPRIPIGTPELLGSIDSVEPQRVWLFLEEVSGLRFDKTEPQHVAAASMWLAKLHGATMRSDIALPLPTREPGHYESLIHLTCDELPKLSANAAIDDSGRELLAATLGHLKDLASAFDSFRDAYSSVPSAMAHGDFKAENMAFVTGKVSPGDLRVFDWSESHRGPVSVDLWWVDAAEYLATLEMSGFHFDRSDFEEWRSVGGLLRWVSAVAWTTPALRYSWVDRGMRKMGIYEKRLGAAIQERGWSR